MGHILTIDVVSSDHRKVQAVLEMPPPEDLKGVQRFFRLMTYLSKFLPHLYEASEPLRRLTMKDQIFSSQSQQAEAFDTIKILVTEQPVLRYYDLEEEVTLNCDANEAGPGSYIITERKTSGVCIKSVD